jgi:hypothetical protein
MNGRKAKKAIRSMVRQWESNMRSIKRLLITAFVLVCIPALAQAQGAASNLVLLKVNDTETALEYNANGSSHGRCVGSSEPGCVRVSGNGSITFRLVNDRNCSSGAKWELNGVQLGGEGSAGKPGAFGGLSGQAASDFSADAGTGWVQTRSASGGGIAMTDANGSAYSLWYRVRASCAGSADIWFDPRIENDGSGPGRG